MLKSAHSHAILDRSSRIIKAKKIVSVLRNYIDPKKSTILDIGTGSGHIPQYLSKSFKSVYSTDLNDERFVKNGYTFKRAKDEHLNFKSDTFDAVVSNHVIEHVPNQKLHISEIHRVLKKGGVLYLATPNKFWLTDPHYKLPFISWLPRKLSEFYLKVLLRKKWDIFPQSLADIKRFSKRKFEIHNATIDIIKYPEKYNLDTFKVIQPIVKIVPYSFMKMFDFALPTLILVLKKI